jgi:CheY-like chemotaxis protein
MGGTLVVESTEKNVGSSFVVEIVPKAVSSSKISEVGQRRSLTPKLTKEHANKLRGVKVLLVEDSPDNQVLIATYLEKMGVSVTSASDGQEGVESALSKDFDIVLMDVQMPRLDGYMATHQLRTANFRKPIIALTAHAMKEERAKCLSFGFTDFLSKPVQWNRLMETISMYKSYHHSQRTLDH